MKGPRIEIREAELGDHGWVLERHADLYPPGSGWDRPFIALVAQVIADYLENLDPERERAWIGEVDGRRAGAVPWCCP